MPSYLKRNNKPTLAYHYYEGTSDLPPLIFLGGFRSDMEGTKALYLEEQCKARGQSFVRFDYAAHGESEGVFEELGITDWMGDTVAIIEHCFDKPAILVGSSMGGWVSLLIGKNHPELVQAIVGLAAAPDFTLWIEDAMSEEQKQELRANGRFLAENDYGDPYVFSKYLLDNGRTCLLLDSSIEISVPVRLLQGKKDADVPWETAERIKTQLTSEDVEITYIEEGDHRLSSPAELDILNQVIETLISA